MVAIRTIALLAAFAVVPAWTVPGTRQEWGPKHVVTAGARPSVVVLSPDGRTLAVGLQGGAVELWDTTSGERSRLLNGGVGPITALGFSPDGGWLAVAGRRRRIEVRQAPHWRVARTLGPVGSAVSSLVFDEDGTVLAGLAERGSLALWSVPTWSAIEPPGGELPAACSLGVAHAGSAVVIVTVAADGTVRRMRASARPLPTPERAGTGGRVRLAPWSLWRQLSADGAVIMCGPSPIEVRDARSGRLLLRVDAESGLGLSRDGDAMACMARPGVLEVWGVRARRLEAAMQDFGPVAATFSQDGRVMATWGTSPLVRVWSLPAGRTAGQG